MDRVAGDFRFSVTGVGDPVRVIVAGDVLALPDERWSMGYFGSEISVEWLLHEARLPGNKVRRFALARCLVTALATYRGAPVPATVAALVRCTLCDGSGWRAA